MHDPHLSGARARVLSPACTLSPNAGPRSSQPWVWVGFNRVENCWDYCLNPILSRMIRASGGSARWSEGLTRLCVRLCVVILTRLAAVRAFFVLCSGPLHRVGNYSSLTAAAESSVLTDGCLFAGPTPPPPNPSPSFHLSLSELTLWQKSFPRAKCEPQRDAVKVFFIIF